MKNEKQIELSFIEKLKELKYIYREDIKDKASLEENFRKRFQELNRVRLSDSEFARLKESIITPDVFSAAKILRETNTFKRDDDTPLQYTLVNTNDWCKNEYEVINQLRINTENSHHRYDVIILISYADGRVPAWPPARRYNTGQDRHGPRYPGIHRSNPGSPSS